MICKGCGKDDELRLGYCFDCATVGDKELGSRSVFEHIGHAVEAAIQGVWWMARMDLQCAWDRFWRTGEYRKGGEWENL